MLFMSENFITNPQDKQYITKCDVTYKRKKSVTPYLLTFLVEIIASMVLHRTQLYQVYALASMASRNVFPKNYDVTYNYL